MEAFEKNLYCPHCKLYPDDIIEVCRNAFQERSWNGEEYELSDVNFGNDIELRCGVCREILEDKPQETSYEATPTAPLV